MTDNKPKSIFISYRRDDSAGYAGRIYDHLRQRFGDDYIFMDVSNIDGGDDWDQKIRDAVSSCDLLLVIIGKRWLIASDEYGRRRLDSRKDYVLLEISTAIKRKITIIPVLVDDAKLPTKDGLPTPLKHLLKHQCCVIRHDKFYPDVDALISSLGVSPQDYVDQSSSLTVREAIISQDKLEISTLGFDTPIIETRYADATFKLLENASDNWQWIKLGECVSLSRSKPVKRDTRETGEYPYYGVSGIIEYVDYYDFDGQYLLVTAVGRDLVNRNRPVATKVEGKFATANGVYVMRLHPEFAEILSLEYLASLFSVIDLHHLISGSAQAMIRPDDLKGIVIPIPPLEEQARLITLIYSQLLEIENIRTTLRQQLEMVDSLENAVIGQIFEGIVNAND